MRMQLHFIPEDRLCLLLAQGRLSPPVRDEALALLAGPLQWDLILERAKEHEVYPLLYRNLKDVEFPGVPAPVRAELEALFRTNALRNTLFAQELAQLLGTLHKAGIPVIPLKGLFLAQLLYGDMSLRVCADMDILVPRQNVAQAAELLTTKGYQAESPRWFLSDHRMRNTIECALWRRERSVHYLVELHWGLLLGAAEDARSMKDLWADAQRKDFLGVPVYALSLEGQLVLLAAHAARHNWQGLKWLVDIHELCLRRDLAWDRATALSKKLGWEQLLRWSVGACRTLLDTPLPSDFPEAPAFVRGYLFPAPAILPSPWHTTLLYLRLAAPPSEKVRVLLRRLLIPTPADAELFHLPSSLSFLYYLVRPFRLGSRLVGSLLGTGHRSRSKPATEAARSTPRLVRQKR